MSDKRFRIILYIIVPLNSGLSPTLLTFLRSAAGLKIHFEIRYKDMGAWRKYILVLFIFSVALSGNALLRGFWLFVQMPDDHKVGANTSKSTTTTTENTNPTLVEPTPKPRQNVILLSSFMRSGSSVIGDIFNNHPDCFYMFEPLHETVLLSLSITAFSGSMPKLETLRLRD